MKFPTIAFFAVGALVLSGCMAYHDVDSAAAIYQSTRPSLGSFSQMSFEQVRAGSSASFGLDDSGPTFEFPRSGKSYFRAFELPVPGPAVLTVRSATFQNGFPTKGFAVFYPVVTFLNAEKQPVATLDWNEAQQELRPPEGFAIPTAYVKLVADMTRYPSARYVVVHTDAAYVGARQKLHYLVPGYSLAGEALLEMTDSKDAAFDIIGAPDAPSGNLKIEFH